MGNICYVKTEAGGPLLFCRLKGTFKLGEYSKYTNPVAVGDFVEVEWDEASKTGIIVNILPRRNGIIRKATNLSKRYHLIAANIDNILVFYTLRMPQVLPQFVDRVLVAAESFHIHAMLVFSKIDMYSEEEMLYLNEQISIYERIGYPCLLTSVETGEGIERIKNILKDKTTVLAGNSGTGKSSLLKTIAPEVRVKISPISEYHQSGRHTTTLAEMFSLSFGGEIIDTPGLRSFAPVDIPREELSHYFPEMRVYLNQCRYHNCQHLNEPGCEVKKALEAGKIAKSRYQSYCAIYHDYDQDTVYRRDKYA